MLNSTFDIYRSVVVTECGGDIIPFLIFAKKGGVFVGLFSHITSLGKLGCKHYLAVVEHIYVRNKRRYIVLTYV